MARLLNSWTMLAPIAAGAMLVLTAALGEQPWLLVGCGVAIIAAVLAAVHHAEVIAHRVGEPFGTLVLALSVTVIEAALLLSLLVAGGTGMETLPRDTVYATVMIITTGVVGLCTLIGGLAHREQSFRVEGAGGGLAALIVLAVVTLVLPYVTITTTVGTYSRAQSLFAAFVSAALWGIFVFVQTVRHRDYFMDAADAAPGGTRPSGAVSATSAVLLLLSLTAVVVLAKVLSDPLSLAVQRAGLPLSFVGVVIAAVVLLPECVAAMKAALLNRLQSSINLALGSAVASIGLTIPAVAAVSLIFGVPLVLGLSDEDMVLLMLT
jgi:Ca2+:H+ antiporter